MNSWAPLWSGLVDSSIWDEPDHVFRVFIAMLSLKDANHVVSMDGYRLAKRIHMDLDTVTDALKILAGPDTKRPDQDFEGRRINKVEDGWEILNGEYYRKLVSEEMRRVRNRKSQRAWRERQKPKPLPGENAYVKNVETNGQAAADADFDREQLAANGESHAAPVQRVETPTERIDREMREKREALKRQLVTTGSTDAPSAPAGS